jgi:hypothetical protein
MENSKAKINNTKTKREKKEVCDREKELSVKENIIQEAERNYLKVF